MKVQRDKIVEDSRGELVRMGEMRLLKGAVNTDGMLAGLPNYAVIPLKNQTEEDKKKLPDQEELENMTPEKLLELEAQGA